MESREKCTAKSKQSGVRCKRYPIRGGTVCAIHGGKTPVVVAAAKRRLEETEAEKAVVLFGARRDVMPGDALLEEVQWTAGHVGWLRLKVQELEARDLEWNLTREQDTKDGMMERHDASPSVWYSLYERERKHLVAASTAALRAGVEERRVRLAESQGQQVAAVIQRVLDGLGLSEVQLGLVPTVVPAALRAIASQ